MARGHALIKLLIVAGICLMAAIAWGETDCRQAAVLFDRSQTAYGPAEELKLLKQAVSLCPTHAAAWNNLGLVHETQGRLMDAENAYRNAISSQPDFAAPYAGLGDLAMSQSRFREATEFFDQFLTILQQEIKKGDPMGLSPYAPEYSKKREQAQLRWQIHQASMTGVVSQKTLTRGFRGIKKVKKTAKTPSRPQRIAVSILFDFNSSSLKYQGKAQLREISNTLQQSEFLSERFLIEGHSDTIGAAEYNLRLSRQRAETVRSYLISQGVSNYRLTVQALGESRPIIRAGDSDIQAVNRRVEFVSMP